jgi:hypothetical protein
MGPAFTIGGNHFSFLSKDREMFSKVFSLKISCKNLSVITSARS